MPLHPVCRRWILASLLLLAACGRGDRLPMPDLPAAAPAETAALVDAPTLAAPDYRALLLAGDASRRVYSNAVLDMRQALTSAGLGIDRVRTMSADPALRSADTYEREAGLRGPRERGAPDTKILPGAIEPPTLALASSRLLDLKATTPGLACLVYLVSTPSDGGLKLSDSWALTPDILDRALIGGCGSAPTLVVVSACDAGAFAAPPMARANRLILTASAGGVSGFGCGPNVGLTTFDECFLGALQSAPVWTGVFAQTQHCVSRREHLVGQVSAGPQAFVGASVAALATPWAAKRPGSGAPDLVFLQGIGRFTLDALPYFPTLKARNAAAANDYLHSPLPKAMALTFAGTLVWVGPTLGETPDDVARLAVERCEYQSGGACILFARNLNLTAASDAGLPPMHPLRVAYSGPVTPGDTPFIREAQRTQIAAYVAMPGPKALALSPTAESIGIGATPAAALAQCLAQGAADCVAYAEGDRIVLQAQP